MDTKKGNDMELKYGSMCSGIEAASAAWDGLGWEPSWFSEIEDFPSMVLKKHFPEVFNIGDMQKIKEMIEDERITAPDIVVAGTPCQSFSITGLRKGLDDKRGGLTLEYCRIADAIDKKRAEQGKPPAVFLWENVVGVLSSKDNAFGCLLAAMSGSEEPFEPMQFQDGAGKWLKSGYVVGKSRTTAWRVLDARHSGVAQRRRRVFLVSASRAGGFDSRKVLMLGSSLDNNALGVHSGPRFDLTTSTCGTCGNRNSRGITILPSRAFDEEEGARVVSGVRGRCLTVGEEEQRQGFKSGWTDVEGDGSINKRYKAIGNSMAVPVMKQLGENIQKEMLNGK